LVTGLDDHGAKREQAADVAPSLSFFPLAALAAGGDVDLGNDSFIDGVNHDADITLNGSSDVYGDVHDETTHAGSGQKDSPDDNEDNSVPLPFVSVSFTSVEVLTDNTNEQTNPDNLPVIEIFAAGVNGSSDHKVDVCHIPPGNPDNAHIINIDDHAVNAHVAHGDPEPPALGICTAPTGEEPPDDGGPDCGTGIANPGLNVLEDGPFTSCARLFNRKVDAGDDTPAWVDVQWDSVDANWTGMNDGYVAAIALAQTPILYNAPAPAGSPTWQKGLFSWRTNNLTDITDPGFPSSCDPAHPGIGPDILCRPSELTPFPDFQTYLGMDDIEFQNLLVGADTKTSNLDNDAAPLGFTYVSGDYTLASSVASPSSTDFGLMYVAGNLTIDNDLTFKGVLFVEGDLTIASGRTPTILGAVMTTGSVVNSGSLRILYSSEAARVGLQQAPAWTVLAWEDPQMRESATTGGGSDL
jgi:hypothetical protein